MLRWSFCASPVREFLLAACPAVAMCGSQFAYVIGIADAVAQPAPIFYASPFGTHNAQCSQEQPCTAQAAVEVCETQSNKICRVNLADGVYLDPAINIYAESFVIYIGSTAVGNFEIGSSWPLPVGSDPDLANRGAPVRRRASRNAAGPA